jgi:hypothetical protein
LEKYIPETSMDTAVPPDSFRDIHSSTSVWFFPLVTCVQDNISSDIGCHLFLFARPDNILSNFVLNQIYLITGLAKEYSNVGHGQKMIYVP